MHYINTKRHICLRNVKLKLILTFKRSSLITGNVFLKHEYVYLTQDSCVFVVAELIILHFCFFHCLSAEDDYTRFSKL